jgi:outer membrane biosynthesis protein TonB
MEVSMSTTTTPPPPRTSSAGFIAAAGVMLVLMGGLLYWKLAVPAAPPPKPPKPVAAPEPTPALEEPPPPPPKLEQVVDAAPKAAQRPKAASGGGPCSAECTGTASAALQAALRAKGGQVRGCYERALRQNSMVQGRLVINVRVGPKGQVCSAGVAQNTLGDPGVASCVLQMFRSGAFPAPEGGCVDAQVPMNFVPKT